MLRHAQKKVEGVKRVGVFEDSDRLLGSNLDIPPPDGGNRIVIRLPGTMVLLYPIRGELQAIIHAT